MLARDVDGGVPAWSPSAPAASAGFVSSGPPRDEDVPLPAAEIYAIYVLAEAWRQGLGRALLETAVTHWRAGGAKTLVLWVSRPTRQPEPSTRRWAGEPTAAARRWSWAAHPPSRFAIAFAPGLERGPLQTDRRRRHYDAR